MNYVEHIKELQNEIPDDILIFMKPNTSIAEEINLRPEKCRYEGEISFLMENKKIIGVAFGIDLTLQDLKNKLREQGFSWEKAKAFDGSAVFSKFIPIQEKDIADLRLEFYLNDELRQNGGVELMMYKPKELLKKINNFFTICDHDIIMTGTPCGVDILKKGDKCLGKIFQKDNLLIEKEWIVK